MPSLISKSTQWGPSLWKKITLPQLSLRRPIVLAVKQKPFRNRLFFSTTPASPLPLLPSSSLLYGNYPSLDVMMLSTLSFCMVAYAYDAYTDTQLHDAQTAHDCQYSATNRLLSAPAVRQLEQDGYVVLKNALTAEELKQVRLELQQQQQQQQASLSLSDRSTTTTSSTSWFSERNHSNDRSVRSDAICWVRCSKDAAAASAMEADAANNVPSPTTQPESSGIALEHCINLIRGVPYALQQHDYQSYTSFRVPQQCQLSQYRGNSQDQYHRHLDQCQHSVLEMGVLAYWRAQDYRGRAVTAILYLNDPDWQHGGALRCYHDNPTPNHRDNQLMIEKQSSSPHGADDNVNGNASNDNNYEDVSPTGGTLIVFDAGRVEHAVLPSQQDRFALTCWINGTAVSSSP